jgi:hypothetical protein
VDHFIINADAIVAGKRIDKVGSGPRTVATHDFTANLIEFQCADTWPHSGLHRFDNEAGYDPSAFQTSQV